MTDNSDEGPALERYYYKIEHIFSDGDLHAGDWQTLKEEFETEEKAVKKMNFYRQHHPGHDWRLWKVYQKETLVSHTE